MIDETINKISVRAPGGANKNGAAPWNEPQPEAVTIPARAVAVEDS